MSASELRDLLRTRPFIPFRVVTTDSTTYEIRHPELVMVSLATAVIGYPDMRSPGIVERYDIVSLRHIIRLEPMPELLAPTGGNGQGQ